MSPARRATWLGAAILFAFGYLVVGVVTADLAHATTPAATRAWRLAAWALSLVLFAVQVQLERRRPGTTPVAAALHVAIAVALGGFLLALAGPVRTHRGTPAQTRSMLALALWPAVTGVPAFLAAYGIAAVFRPGKE